MRTRMPTEAGPSWAMAPVPSEAATLALSARESRRMGLAAGPLSLRRSWPRDGEHLLLEYVASDADIVAGQWFGDSEQLELAAADTAAHGPVACVSARGNADVTVLLQARGADRRLHSLAPLASRPDSTLVAHRAERRAVVRMGTGRERRYARVLPPERVGAAVRVLRAGRHLVDGAVRTPVPIEVDERGGVIVTGALPGTPLHELLGGREGLEQAGAVGRALQALHTARPGPELAPHGPVEEAGVLKEWIERVDRHAAGLADRVGEIAEPVLDRLERLRASELVPAHRDFHDGQVLLRGAGVSLVDLDTLCLAEPALDLANMLVHLELRALQGLCSPEWAGAARAALVEGYGAPPYERLQLYADATRLRLVCVYAFRPRWSGVVPALLRSVGRPLEPSTRNGRGAATRRRPPAPPDPALPMMATLLEGEAMAPVLERSLGRRATVRSVHPVYLRHKPGRQLVVHYEADVAGAAHEAVATIAADSNLADKARTPRNLELARGAAQRSPAAFPLYHDHDLDALIQWLPLDVTLPALAEAEASLRRRLRAAGLALRSEAAAVRLAYKPRRHAVLRLDGHVVKAYAKESHFERAARRLHGSSAIRGVSLPRLVGTLPDWRATVQSALEGSAPAEAAQVAPAVGAALRVLHRSRVEGLTLNASSERLHAAAAGGRYVAQLSPRLTRRVEALLARLEDARPPEFAHVTAHGDLTPQNVLLRDGEVAFVDLDRLCAGPPALDFGIYAARVLLGREGDLQAAYDVLDALVEGYGERPRGLTWHLAAAILCQAQFPFRYVRADWPERVDALVGDAERALRAQVA
jgi:Ser/Thr protein kinase RdoA (MazF antagonist)